MKYLLIMQLLYSGFNAGGASIETIKFDNIHSCEKVRKVFMSMEANRTYRKAMCVPITEDVSK